MSTSEMLSILHLQISGLVSHGAICTRNALLNFFICGVFLNRISSSPKLTEHSTQFCQNNYVGEVKAKGRSWDDSTSCCLLPPKIS